MTVEETLERRKAERAESLRTSLWILGDLHLAEKEAVIYAQERPQRREQVQEDAPPKVRSTRRPR